MLDGLRLAVTTFTVLPSQPARVDRETAGRAMLWSPVVGVGIAGVSAGILLAARNIFAGPEAGHKLQVLREHCAAEGRNYDEIAKTTMLGFDAAQPAAMVEQLRGLHELGFTTAHLILKRSDDFAAHEALAAVAAEVAPW